jgi:predicted secreted protein
MWLLDAWQGLRPVEGIKHMKFHYIAAVVAALAVATPALAEDLHISIKNNTSEDLTELYVSHVGTNSWEENILPEDAEPGATQPVDIEDGRSTCEYDIKAVFSDGGKAEFRNQNLCEVTTFSVHD